MRHRLFILLFSAAWFSVEGFTEFAGDCGGDGPAVGGLHLNNVAGSRLIYTDSLNANHISFFVNGKDIMDSDGVKTAIPIGVEHTLEIVAKHPFKGALIRLESTPQDLPFTLIPLINAQVAVACVLPVVGVTQTSSKLKTVLSAGFQADEVGQFVLDVTVVDFNNATGSVYWYSQLFIEVVDVNDDAPVPTPQNDGATAYPTYSESCDVCDGHGEVRNMEVEITLKGEDMTCRQLQEYASMNLIPPNSCSSAQVQAVENCGCSDSTNSEATNLPTYSERCYVCGSDKSSVTDLSKQITVAHGEGSCQYLQEEGANGFIDPEICASVQVVAQAECGCVSIASPTALPSPYPTYSESCLVCGSDSKVSLPDHIISVDGGSGTCGDLELDGLNGYIAPSLCNDAKVIALMECGCSVPGPVPSSSTFVPTITSFPTYAEECNLCIEDGWEVTNLSAEVHAAGEAATCQELQEIIHNRLFPPELCLLAQQGAAEVCGCAPTSPAMGPALTTLAPTSTASPTSSTFVPTYTETCHICEAGHRVSFGHVEIVVDQLIITCAELEQATLDRMLPPEFCSEATDVAKKYCGCIQSDAASDAVSTFAPSTSPGPTQTPLPTFHSACHVCGDEDKVVTQLSATLLLDGLELTCLEVQDAAEGHVIPPDVCPDAMTMVQKRCGCEPANKTATASDEDAQVHSNGNKAPTGPKCYLCGESGVITKPKAHVVIGGLGMTCSEAEKDGLTGALSPLLCVLATTAAGENCGCDEQLSLGVELSASTRLAMAWPTTTLALVLALSFWTMP